MTPAARHCFAAVTPGFEIVTEREVRALGVADIAAVPGGVAFRTDDAGLMRANLRLRTASRVLVRIASFTAKSFAELERRAKPVAWNAYVAPGSRIALRVTCRKSRLYHSDAVAERLAKWIAAAVPGVEVTRALRDREDGGAGDEHDERGVADAAHPARRPAERTGTSGAAPVARQLFVVRFDRDVCTISADSSGELLHRRGYRLATAKAPMRETLAAGALLAIGYDGTIPLLDPMCGAGTIAIEAALIARNIAPGIRRAFACEAWPGFDRGAIARERAAARAEERPPAGVAAPHHPNDPLPGRALIIASDRDAGAIEAAAANAERAGVAADLALSRRALSAIEAMPGPGLLLTNPPYGARVGERAALRNLYAQLGNVARAKLPGWRVAIVSAERSLEAQTRLPLETVTTFSNGGIKVRLVATPGAS